MIMKCLSLLILIEQVRSPILDHITVGLTKLGRRGSHLLKDLIEVEMVDFDDEDNFDNASGLEDPGLHEVAGFGSLVLDLPTPPREDPNPEVNSGSFMIAS